MDDEFVQEAYEPDEELLVPVDDLADISGGKLNKKAAARAAADARVDDETPVPVQPVPVIPKKPISPPTPRMKTAPIHTSTTSPQVLKQKKQVAPVLLSKKPMPQKVVSAPIAPVIKPVFSRTLPKKETVQQTIAVRQHPKHKKVIIKRNVVIKRKQPIWDYRKISIAIIALLLLGGIVFSYAFSHAQQQAPPLILPPAYDSSCIVGYGIPVETVLFVYTPSCDHCVAMSAIVQGMKVTPPLLSVNLAETMNHPMLKDCFSGVLANAVPQFICAKSGASLIGIQSKDTLETFADACALLP